MKVMTPPDGNVLAFHEPSHTYRWNGKVVPSVTQLIKPYGPSTLRFIDRNVLELARQKGRAIHLMVELHLLGELERIPEWQEPFMDAWLRFADEQQFQLIATERRLHHPTMGYAGTPDLIGSIKVGRSPAVIDLKRSLIGGRGIGLQTAGYKRLWNAQPGNENVQVSSRYALILHDDRSYTLQPFTDPQDDAAFLAALTLWKWQQQGA